MAVITIDYDGSDEDAAQFIADIDNLVQTNDEPVIKISIQT